MAPLKKVTSRKPAPRATGKAVKKPLAKAALTNTLVQAPRKGTTAYAKYALDKAIKGGAAKTAAKLTKPIKTDAGPAYSFRGSDGTIGYSRARKYTYEDAGMGSAKQVKGEIINDLSKTAMRAKIIEMNAKKKKKK